MCRKSTEKLANELKQRLERDLGGEWKTKVWFNLWWCYSAQCGTITVIPRLNAIEFTAFVSSDEAHSGALSAWFNSDDAHECPAQAVKNAMKTAREYVNELKSALKKNEFLINQL